MLATLAIINMAVAAVLINDTIDERAIQEPAAIVVTTNAPAHTVEDYSWAEE